MPDRSDYLEAIDRGRAELIDAVRAAGLDAPVPTARRWRVRDLVVHVGNVHAWARDVVTAGVEQPQVFDAEPPGVGPDLEDLLGWYDEQAAQLLALLSPGAGVRDDQACWTFGPPGTVAFWPRRQAHELAIHALDATLAAGAPLRLVKDRDDVELAADGVDEVLTVMMPRVADFVPRPTLPGRLGLATHDTGDEWILESDGRLATAAGGPEPIASLTAEAATLFALLWRRLPLSQAAEFGVRVDGDPAAVEALFAARLTP